MTSKQCLGLVGRSLLIGAVPLVIGCAQHHKDPYAEAGLTRPPLERALENADNETWRVIDLKLETVDGGERYSFGFNPASRNNPFENTQVGLAPAEDVVGIGKPIHGVSAALADSEVIVVRRGSIYPLPASVVRPEPGGVPSVHHAARSGEGPTTRPIQNRPDHDQTPASPA